jgi:hypothetical protein
MTRKAGVNLGRGAVRWRGRLRVGELIVESRDKGDLTADNRARRAMCIG